jgi:hypothetical protein
VPNGEWTLHPTKRGVTLRLYEWKELTTFHCGNDKLTPTLVGIVSVFQNLRSTLLLPFHSVSYLPPPRDTLTGMFNAWVWSLANVTVKTFCSRSPCVRVNGMFKDLRFWKTDTIPTKVGVSLSLPQWKVLYSDMQVLDDLIS